MSVFYDLNGLSNRIRRRGVRTKGKKATRIDKMLIFLLVFAAYVYVFKYRKTGITQSILRTFARQFRAMPYSLHVG